MRRKPNFNLLIIVFSLLTIVLTACTSEDLLTQVIEASQDPVPDPDPEPDPDPTPNTETLKINTTPCTYTLASLSANESLAIDCQLDLEGQTVNLPANVTLSYNGGEIINGTLKFSAGKIDGELLNSKLEVNGAVVLTDPNFQFYPERWDIVEGSITEQIAFANHENIQNALDLTKALGATVFAIAELDAFFYSGEKLTPVIEMPSNIHFAMSSNTHLRVFPDNKEYSSWMFRIRNENNVTISGGFIHGDRDEHGNTEDATGGVLIWIMSGIDIVIENVNMSNALGTGLTVNSYLFADNPDYIPSQNVLITGCTFDSNRTNNLSITDGKDIRVENCKLYRAGVDTQYSLGRAPRIGIVVEPVTGQKVDGVVISNNILEGTGGRSSILVALGNDVLITGNTADKQVGWTSASNIKVINNPGLKGGVIAGFNNDFALGISTNNVISGNTITGAPTGIYATNDDIKIFDNTLTNCVVGIQMVELKDSEIYNNTIKSNVSGSYAFRAQKSLNNVLIRNNTVNMEDGRAIGLQGINSDVLYDAYSFELKDNEFESGKPSIISDLAGLTTITGNSFTVSGLGISNSHNVIFENNNMVSNSGPCLTINKTLSTSNITVKNNSFENTNSNRLEGFGLRISSFGATVVTEDSNILVQNNEVSVGGDNYGIYVKEMDGITIKTNKGEAGDYPLIYFRGNNSEITNNETISGTEGHDIEGNNNVVSGNN